MTERDPARDAATVALTALVEHGVPVDIQELLVYGNPSAGIKPGALSACVSAVLRVVGGETTPKQEG